MQHVIQNTSPPRNSKHQFISQNGFKITKWMEQRYVALKSSKNGETRSVASFFICFVTVFDFASHELLDALRCWQA